MSTGTLPPPAPEASSDPESSLTRGARVLNPVLRRELLERWRGRRAFLVLTVYVGLLAGLFLLLAWIGTRVLADGGIGFGFASAPTLGRFLLDNMLAFVLMLVLFVGPGYAAAQISGERERRTLGLLRVTLVSPLRIVLGKLGAAVAWLVLLVVAAVPFVATAFFLGGVSLADLVRGVVVVVVVAVSVAGLGIGVSSLTRRTTASVIGTYAVVLVLLVGTILGAVVEAAVGGFDGDERPDVLYLNPYYGLADAVRADRAMFFGGELPSVLTPWGFTLPHATDRFDGGFVDDAGGFDEPERTPVWLITSALYLAMGAGGVLLAARRVRGERHRARPLPRDRHGDPVAGPVAGASPVELSQLPPPRLPPRPPGGAP